MSNFTKAIDRLEDLVLSGMGVPLTSLTMINGEKVVPLMDRIRETLPEEIKESQRILMQREQVINDAQMRANQLLQDAKGQAEMMLSESELLKAVHLEAERVRQEILNELEGLRRQAYEEGEAYKAKAIEDSRQVRESADHYADTILGTLDKSLGEFQSVIRNGQKYIKRTRTEAGTQYPQPHMNAPQYQPIQAKQPHMTPAYADMDMPLQEQVNTANAARYEEFIKNTTVQPKQVQA